ncbi:SCP2 sterol-binding domain-containing protein [Acerihabitans sp. KWT182]|uniref:Ubiquinone biosynthesis accessory factor UbiJ n=1 Tax=Acerihabitans sp. KWT182 TaxID=3157919 RepID=A0AAU7Q936_9GAMM
MLMLLIAATLEMALKRLVYQDQFMKTARQRLKGKTLRFELAELDSPIILVFGEAQADVLTSWDDPADCTVKTHFSAVPALRRRQQLSSLIKQGDLEVDGDIQLVQQFVALLDMAELDPAELLSPYLGDILAEGLTQRLAAHVDGVKRRWVDRQTQWGQAVTEEWRLSPSALELAWFNEEVNTLEQDEVALAARLEKMEVSR